VVRESELARPAPPSTLPRVGVSACLLGEAVRYDGGHKRLDALLEEFRGKVEWRPVCPEVEMGLGVPRETIQLERRADGIRLIAATTRRDLTGPMRQWAASRLASLAEERLCGYVFKARSPSCGLDSTPAAGGEGRSSGLFAALFRERFPSIPLAEEEDLRAPAGRERFLGQVLARAALRRLFDGGAAAGEIVEFHSCHKLLLLSRSPEDYALLGRLTARAADIPSGEFERRYVERFMAAIAAGPHPGRLVNALLHAAGYFAQDSPERQRLVARIGALREDDSRVSEVQRLILEEARRSGHEYLLRQSLLAEDPWRPGLLKE
jgi:uncharacterized protein YbbK (DUF523 family)/uncharacterized protein YbgA (DUF1722 family)